MTVSITYTTYKPALYLSIDQLQGQNLKNLYGPHGMNVDDSGWLGELNDLEFQFKEICDGIAKTDTANQVTEQPWFLKNNQSYSQDLMIKTHYTSQVHREGVVNGLFKAMLAGEEVIAARCALMMVAGNDRGYLFRWLKRFAIECIGIGNLWLVCFVVGLDFRDLKKVYGEAFLRTAIESVVRLMSRSVKDKSVYLLSQLTWAPTMENYFKEQTLDESVGSALSIFNAAFTITKLSGGERFKDQYDQNALLNFMSVSGFSHGDTLARPILKTITECLNTDRALVGPSMLLALVWDFMLGSDYWEHSLHPVVTQFLPDEYYKQEGVAYKEAFTLQGLLPSSFDSKTVVGRLAYRHWVEMLDLKELYKARDLFKSIDFYEMLWDKKLGTPVEIIIESKYQFMDAKLTAEDAGNVATLVFDNFQLLNELRQDILENQSNEA